VRDLGRGRAIDAIVSFAVRGMAEKSFARVLVPHFLVLIALNSHLELKLYLIGRTN